MTNRYTVPFLALILTAVGCATVNKPATTSLTGDVLIDGPLAISSGPPRDKVLWQYRTAVEMLRMGDVEHAKPLLDDALLTLGGIYGKDKSAKKARGTFHEESKKTFLGEPYERVMAYYYRGMIYWMDGEPDNARACFRTGQLEDGSVEEKYSGDYVLLDYLDGLATTKLGQDGSDALQRASKNLGSTNSCNLPPYDPDSNFLIFIEFGNGPEKYATGKYHEELRFRSVPSATQSAIIKVDDSSAQTFAYDDLSFQATTRGGRVMDHILGNKAVFKTTTDVAGNVAVIGGAATLIANGGQSGTANAVGGGLLALGIVSTIVSSQATPAADTRCWDNLPRYLSFSALKLSPGQHTATVEFLNGTGQTQDNLTKRISFEVPNGKVEKVVFVSDRSHETRPK